MGQEGEEAIRWSSEGKSWENQYLHSGPDLHAVASNNGQFIAVGAYGLGGIYTSSDGKKWEEGNNRTGNDFYGIAYGNGKFVAVGDGVIAYLAAFSSTWIKTTSGFNTYHKLNDIVWNDSIFVAVGDQGVIYTSVNGINWSKKSSTSSITLKSVTYSSELNAFFAVGNNVVLKSSNGSSWEALSTKDPEGNPISMKLDSIFSAPVSTDKTEWAVFAINGRINLTGSSSIEPFDYNNISGSVGINANSKINGKFPVSLGQGAQSVISPCYNFYFGPDSDPTTLVGDINQGDEAKNRVYSLKNDSKILDKIQEFYIPSWLAFEETGISGLPDKGSYQAGWNGGPFEIGYGDSGYYDKFEVLSKLTIKVYDEDVIIHANSFKISGSGGQQPDVRIERYGKGRVFILVNQSLELSSDARIYSYDGSGNQITYDDNLFLFYNGTAAMSGWPQFHFSGLLYIKQAPIKIGGSTSVSGLVSLHDKVTVSGAGISSHYVYAPYADITMDNSGEVQGSVIGKSIDILNDGKIKYRLVEIPVPEIPQSVASSNPSGCCCSPQDQWLTTLCLDPDNISYGSFAQSPEDGTTSFDDNYKAYLSKDFTVVVEEVNGKIKISQLWGSKNWSWTLNSINRFFMGKGNSINLQALYINLGSYIGDITIENRTNYGIRVKIPEDTGHTNGYEISKNKTETYIASSKNNKWTKK